MTLPHRPIYLDYASTTPVHPRVLEAMEPYLRQEFGNPSNLYALGRRAADALERARAQVAAILGSHDGRDRLHRRRVRERQPGAEGRGHGRARGDGISSPRRSSTARCWAPPATSRSTGAWR